MLKINFKQFITRCKNPKILTSIISGILLVLVNAGIIDTHMSNNITVGVNTILSLGVAFGIFSNPDTPKVKETPVEIIKQAENVVNKVIDKPVAPVQPTENTQTK